MTTIKLGDVATEVKSSNKGDKTGCKIVGLEHLTPSDVTLSAWSDDTNNSFTKEFSKGDVLFGRRRAYLKKAAVAPFDGICSGDITVIRAKEGKVIPQLLPFIIQNDFLFDYAVEKSAGSLSPRVKWEHLKNFEIILPDMEKQKQLADTLWSINQTKQAYLALIKQTDELVKSQFIEMFGRIDENRFPQKQWKDVVTIQNGKDHKKISGEGPYGVYGTGGRMLDCSEYMCEPGTIIMGRKGTIDNPYMVDERCWIVDTAFGVNPKVEDLNPIYLYYYTKLIDYSALNKAAVLPSVTKSDLLELWIGMPEIELQDAFEQLYRQSDKSKFELQDAIDNLDALSKKIIAENLIAAGKE